MKYGKGTAIVAGFLAGVVLASFIKLTIISAFGVFVLSSAGLVIMYLFGWHETKGVLKHSALPFLILIFIGSASLGVFRLLTFSSRHGDPRLEASAGKAIVAEGVVVEEPEIRDQDIRLTISLDRLQSTQTTGPPDELISLQKTKILATVASYSHFAYGDRVIFKGVLQKPQNFEGSNGNDFDYVSYLANDRIFYLSKNPTLSLILQHQGNPIKELLLDTKEAFLDHLSRVIVSPESDLMAGLLVEGKESLTSDWQDKFKRAGVIHVVALSGYNVTVVAEALAVALSFLPQTIALSAGALGILGFTVMAGAGSTIIRASVMALLVIAAKILRRPYTVTRALLIAGVGMVALKPTILLHDPSFQLSFLSTIGLIYVSPLVEHFIGFVPGRYKLREIVVVTLATQIFVTPFILYTSGLFSVVALPVNLLILSLVPLTMLFGFVTGAISFFSTVVSIPFAFVSYLLLHYDLGVVSFFSSLSFAAVSISYFPTWLLLATYGVYGIILSSFYGSASEKLTATEKVPLRNRELVELLQKEHPG